MLVCERYFRIGRWKGIVEKSLLFGPLYLTNKSMKIYRIQRQNFRKYSDWEVYQIFISFFQTSVLPATVAPFPPTADELSETDGEQCRKWVVESEEDSEVSVQRLLRSCEDCDLANSLSKSNSLAQLDLGIESGRVLLVGIGQREEWKKKFPFD